MRTRLGPGRALVSPLFALEADGGARAMGLGRQLCPCPGVLARFSRFPVLGSEQAPEERAAGDPAQGGQAGQPALQRADVRPLPAELGPPQPQGQHLPGLQPLGVSGLPFLQPQQLLALQSLRQGGVSTRGQVPGTFCMLLLSPSSSQPPQLGAPWPSFPSPAGLLQRRAAVSALTSRGGHPRLGDGELGSCLTSGSPSCPLCSFSPLT